MSKISKEIIMSIEIARQYRNNRIRFEIPEHKRFYLYPPSKPQTCDGKGIVEIIDDLTTAQALIIVCISCGKRWGSSIDAFPSISAMDHNHPILDPHFVAPLLPKLQAELNRDEENTKNFISNCSSRWEGKIDQ